MPFYFKRSYWFLWKGNLPCFCMIFKASLPKLEIDKNYSIRCCLSHCRLIKTPTGDLHETFLPRFCSESTQPKTANDRWICIKMRCKIHGTNICSELGSPLGRGDIALSSLINIYFWNQNSCVKQAKDPYFQLMCQEFREEEHGKKCSSWVIKGSAQINLYFFWLPV